MKMFHYLLFPLTVSWHRHSNCLFAKLSRWPKATEALFASGAQKIAIITGANNTGAPSDYRLAVINKQWKNMAQKNDSTN